jgi:hypothetical protein
VLTAVNPRELPPSLHPEAQKAGPSASPSPVFFSSSLIYSRKPGTQPKREKKSIPGDRSPEQVKKS